MPVISMFYGIIVRLYHFDDEKHHSPHLHVEYGDDSCVVDINSSKILKGSLSNRNIRLVDAWIEIHREELLADWNLAVKGEDIFKIKPLD